MAHKVAWEGELIGPDTLQNRVELLEEWQKLQNGSIQRIECKVDRMIYLHFGELFAIFLAVLAYLLKH